VYQSRIDGISTLLDREQQHRKVETVILSSTDPTSSAAAKGSEFVEVTESARKLEVQQHKSHVEAIELKISEIKQQQDLLRRQIEEAKEDNAARRAHHKKQEIEVTNEQTALSGRRPRALDPLHAEIRRFERRLDKTRAKTTRDRQTLCRNAARVAGLQRRERRGGDGRVKEEYMINLVQLGNLKDLNSKSHGVANSLLR